ncbi:MAG: heme-binding domain-containing protein [Chloroflexi bacterium]|nr:heme-binding domain-containing protein [Chloroflexota bacterium]
MKKIIKLTILAAVVLLALSQLAVNALKSNPPVLAEPQWDSPQTRALAVRACFDCHSNETVWPWYSNLPPVSWLVVIDTMRGRGELNFSEWRAQGVDAGEMREVMLEGEMPPAAYLLTHPAGRLSDAEKQQLMDGLARSLGQ